MAFSPSKEAKSGVGIFITPEPHGFTLSKESSYYYLQSRYYNPEVGRFINADIFVSTGQGILGNNMFAYCGNNPVNRIDPTGKLFGTICAIIAVGAVVGAAMGAFSAATTGGNIVEAAIEGALTGAASSVIGLCAPGTILPVFMGAIAGGVIDCGVQVVSRQINQGYIDIENDIRSIDPLRAAESAATTAISCAIPKFGTPNNDAVDAFATALLWGEGSALVTALDVAAHKMFDHFRSKKDSLLEQLWNDDSGKMVCRGVL